MQDFYEAFINCSHKVLGKHLKPFSLTHCLYLEAIDSPFMKVINGEQAEITRRDLDLAVLVCSSKDDILQNLSRAYYPHNWTMKLYSFKRNCTAFLGYLSDFLTVPDMWDSSDSKSSINSPWILSKATILMLNTNLTRNEIWNMPIGELLWYIASMAELEGVAQIQSDEEKRMIDEAIKERAKS